MVAGTYLWDVSDDADAVGVLLALHLHALKHGTSSMGGLASPSDHCKEGMQGAMATAVKPRLCYTRFKGEAG